ncbi:MULTISPECIES: PTS fructose transporter subunit IIABC [unclassified Luteococcus]|uniref:PTS fructose transporter subunit IIABC n=1 Tax=unclassified Luteococcus TaxID=2639923 RepID=UPI00313D587B
MSTPSLIEPGLVALDTDLGATKDDVIRGLAGIVAATGRAEADGLAADALEREGKSPTGMPGGFAIPHCRSAAVNTASLGFARLSTPVDFGDKGGPADLVFLIAAAESGGADHMKLLTKLARALVKKDFLTALREARTPDEIVTLVRGVVEPEATQDAAPAAAAAAGSTAVGTAASTTSGSDGGKPSIIAITACPTGIAHTYMAADYLTGAGEEMGVEIVTEPQGSTATDPVTADQIKSATAVIFATDVGVKGRERFAGLPVIESGVKRAINEPKKMIQEALAAAKDPNAPRVKGDAASAAASGAGGAKSQLGWGKRIQQALMTGVSYMVPFVAAGGLLIALGFLLGGYQIPFVGDHILENFSITNLPSYAEVANASKDGVALFKPDQVNSLPHNGLLLYLGAMLWKLGALAFGFLLPALAGYIAFAMADRPGIVPGFVAGAVAGATGAGFLGALVGGLIAGAVAAWIGGWKVPRWLRGLMPVVIIPLLASLVAGGLLYLFLASPISALMDAMDEALKGMNGSSAIVLGIVLGLMMCFDLGGPVNKTAYLFATTNLAVAATPTPSMKIMAAVMAAGMVPPIALAIATAVRPKLFTKVEQENGTACWLLGSSFISEGAIPFAAADPLRIIPATMAGGAITGAMTMALGVASKAPHGGFFVFFAIDKFWGFVLSILIGSLVSAALVVLLKSTKKDKVVAPAAVSA